MQLETHLGFTRNRRNGADLLLLEGIDDTTLPDVGVPDQTDRDLLLVRMEDRELSQKLDQRSFSERVVDGCVERDGGSLEGEVFHPSSLIRGRTRIVSVFVLLDGDEARTTREKKGCRTQN